MSQDKVIDTNILSMFSEHTIRLKNKKIDIKKRSNKAMPIHRSHEHFLIVYFSRLIKQH